MSIKRREYNRVLMNVMGTLIIKVWVLINTLFIKDIFINLMTNTKNKSKSK